jgi:phosphohistidine phosphatase
MKRLYVLRHAKSSWDDASLSDFDRPLNERGLDAAPLMGKVMRKRGYIPDAVFSSPAKRAKKTAKLATDAAGIESSIIFDERIYEASPQKLVEVLSTVDGAAASAMIVGHNPGMEGLIRLLTGETVSMPTAALAIIDLEVEQWNDLDHQTGKLVAMLRPKELGNLI